MGDVLATLEIPSGDDYNMRLGFEETDLTDSTVKLIVKEKTEDADALFEIDVTDHEDPTAGVTVFPIPKEQTALLIPGSTYVAQFRIVDSGEAETSLPIFLIKPKVRL